MVTPDRSGGVARARLVPLPCGKADGGRLAGQGLNSIYSDGNRTFADVVRYFVVILLKNDDIMLNRIFYGIVLPPILLCEIGSLSFSLIFCP